MTSALQISSVRLTRAGDMDVGRGLLGYVALVLDGAIELDGLALRRTQHGRLTLSFPARTDDQGRRHAYVRPLDDAVCRQIETQVLQALGLEEERP